MKIRTSILMATALILTSCGTSGQLASTSEQRFQDGIYSNRQISGSSETPGQSAGEVQALAQKTRNSTIYMIGKDKQEAIVVPDDMAARFDFDGNSISSVTIADNPFDDWSWRNSINFNFGYGPWYGSSWRYGWGNPYRYGFYDPWYWDDPWYYSYRDPWYWGYNDPWYWGYDPWYRDPWYWGYNDPWYYRHHHIYAGFYPYWGHHYPGYCYPTIVVTPGRDISYGPRNGYSSGRVGTASHVRRSSQTSSRSNIQRGYTRADSSSDRLRPHTTGRRTGPSATTETRTETRRTGLGFTRSSVTRTPSVSSGSQSGNRASSSSSNSGYNRGTSTTSRTPAYNRGSSSSSSSRNTGYNRGNSNRSSSSSTSRNTQYRRPSSSSSSSYRSNSSGSYRSSGNSSYNRSSSSSGYRSSSSSSYRSSSSSSHSSGYSGSSSSSSRSGGSSTGMRR